MAAPSSCKRMHFYTAFWLNTNELFPFSISYPLALVYYIDVDFDSPDDGVAASFPVSFTLFAFWYEDSPLCVPIVGGAYFFFMLSFLEAVY